MRIKFFSLHHCVIDGTRDEAEQLLRELESVDVMINSVQFKILPNLLEQLSMWRSLQPKPETPDAP